MTVTLWTVINNVALWIERYSRYKRIAARSRAYTLTRGVSRGS